MVLTARVDRDQALRYLGPGVDGSAAPRSLRTGLAQAEQWVLAHVLPRAVYRTGLLCPVSDAPEGSVTRVQAPTGRNGDHPQPVEALELPSARLAGLLAQSDRATVLAVTLGGAVDQRIGELSRSGRLVDAVVLDAVASASAECAADDLCQVVAAEADAADRRLTRCFSPGYGDLPLTIQEQVLCWLGASRIGLAVTPSSMLVPQKSVTAVVGWAPKGDDRDPQSHRLGCPACDAADCPYRDSDRPDRPSEVQTRES